jgi:CheY-like chemotaxis protein
MKNSQAKFLLCEDNEINAAIAKRILSVFGASVDCAVNGEEGPNSSASAPGDYFAILMDIQMPILNGYEATERIRSYHRPDAKKIPIIAMTADAFQRRPGKEQRSRHERLFDQAPRSRKDPPGASQSPKHQ